MVSRRKILSRSRDDLNLEQPQVEDEENVWYTTETCFEEHIHEVFLKWSQIDDEIWSKVIVFEKNRRVAKAYLRSPVLTVNGTNIGFDGFRLGLAGFENPMREPKTEEVISRQIGLGCKLRMDEDGNILVKRISNSNVYVKAVDDENSISNDVLRLPNQALELSKPIKAFDIRKFEANIDKEMRKIYPNRSKLEAQCILPIAFSKNAPQLLQCPSWVMIINVVALDMLKSKLPNARAPPPNIRNRPRLPVPEEDPYSVTGSSSSNGSKPGKPPKLPPREGGKSNSKGEYVYIEDSILRPFRSSRKNGSKDAAPKNDDPYYCGLRARTTNFKGSDKDRADMVRGQYMAYQQQHQQQQQQAPILPAHPHPGLYHARSYESAMGKPFMPLKPMPKMNKLDRNPMSWVPSHQQNYDSSDYGESVYAPLYGRLPPPKRGYLPPPPPRPQHMYGRPWE
ncbi:uncharacterized protein LOC108675829 isoform X1 [Hyalella azteca]|uniref:Uncharacterized protein LOC108675829 isoform X1 n=1 Tax=Hyalella azteca TaxID=294128 RepID=A0A8B7P006_HYAAZ|nr:uncharacterized protein LOC108675829 isoform X1 [Hyalella azteca]XP_018019350.1 uncharacterized protein LOC108675829 isoform X1 [Hyalella azteca]